MLRLETRGRARALQILYAWELQGAPPVHDVAAGLSRLTGPEPRVLDFAEELAARSSPTGTRSIGRQRWRRRTGGSSGIAIVERNILRIAIQELQDGTAPPRVVIDEAVRLAHWFGGAKAAPFINGVLDRVARSLGRL